MLFGGAGTAGALAAAAALLPRQTRSSRRTSGDPHGAEPRAATSSPNTFCATTRPPGSDRPKAFDSRPHARPTQPHHSQPCCSPASPPAPRTVHIGLVSSLSRGVSRAIPTMDRRAFLRRSGLGVGAGIAASQLTLVKKAKAADAPRRPTRANARSRSSAPSAATARWAARSTRWSRTASGCGRSRCSTRPINLGAHCAKGAALREHGHGEFRLKYPMKLVNGKYQRISWDTALSEISAKMLELRKEAASIRSSSSARRSTTTSRRTCCASG